MKKRAKVAFQDGIISTEDLPKRIVLYPGFYGSFFGFQNDEKSQVTLCECSKIAIENYINFRLKRKGLNAKPERNFILDSMYFPISLIRELIASGCIQNESIIEKIRFEPNLCHECNKQIPYYRYCVPMYGGVFKQTYGWYINKQALEMGIEPISNKILFDKVSDEILNVIEIDPEKIWKDFEMKDQYGKAFEEKRKQFQEQNRKVWNIIENEVRRKFGFKNVGESWANETLIYHLMKIIYPNDRIFFHHRPEWLNGLEIDVYNETQKIGIEYQGIQHYKPIEYWGGEDALEKTKERDKKKKQICSDLKIKLVHITYKEDVTIDLLREKILMIS